MNWGGRRGCIILLLLLVLFAGIYFYAATKDVTPSPNEGFLPPPKERTAPPATADPRG